MQTTRQAHPNRYHQVQCAPHAICHTTEMAPLPRSNRRANASTLGISRLRRSAPAQSPACMLRLYQHPCSSFCLRALRLGSASADQRTPDEEGNPLIGPSDAGILGHTVEEAMDLECAPACVQSA
jgi:hypothetical protein